MFPCFQSSPYNPLLIFCDVIYPRLQGSPEAVFGPFTSPNDTFTTILPDVTKPVKQRKRAARRPPCWARSSRRSGASLAGRGDEGAEQCHYLGQFPQWRKIVHQPGFHPPDEYNVLDGHENRPGEFVPHSNHPLFCLGVLAVCGKGPLTWLDDQAQVFGPPTL